MTSKLVVNTIEADTGISSVSFASSISMNSTAKFHFSAAGIDIGADTNINRPASGVLGFNINSSEKVRIDSSGRMLLGTTTEGGTGADNLTIATSGATGITVRSGTSSNGNLFFSDGTSGADEYRGVVQYNHTGNFLRFYTNGAEKLRIDSTGRLLVNTTTGFAGDNTMVISGESPSGGTYDLYDGQLLITSNETSGAVNTGGVIQFYGHDGGSSRGFGSIRCLKENGTSGNHNAYMAFLLRVNGGNPTERLRISSQGYVTKPAHPSFCARYQSGDGYVSTDIFRLTLVNNDNFSWNNGGHYSTSTGKFTAPVAGVYYFEAQAMTTGHSNGDNIQDMLQLRTNNGLVTYARQRRTYFRSEDDANGYYTNSTAGQVNLAAGDTVWFQRKSGHSWGFGNTNYTYFTGWLIG